LFYRPVDFSQIDFSNAGSLQLPVKVFAEITYPVNNITSGG